MTKDVRKFIIRGGLFLLIFIFVLFGFNYLYIKKIEHRTIFWRNYFSFDEYLQKNKNLDYAFFGTSRTRDSMNPEYIPNSINFSLSSQNYMEIYYRLKYYLENYNLKIDNIVFEIDSSILLSENISEKQLANYDYAKFIPFDEIVDLSGLSKVDVFIRSNFPFIGRGLLAYGALRTSPMDLYLGWAKEIGDFSKNPMDIEKWFKTIKKKSKIPDKLAMQYFVKTLEIAKQNNMNIIFLKNPYAKKSRDLFKKYKVDFSEYYKIIFDKLSDLGVEYHLLDYYTELADNPEYFHVDAGHVNYRGAEVISKKFVKDVGRKELK